MYNLLFELFCEEIPAKLQKSYSEKLRLAIAGQLQANDLTFGSSRAFATPNRLTTHFTSLPLKQQDKLIQRKGPRVNAPDKAISGFMQACGISSLDQAEIVRDNKKGDFYVVNKNIPGKETPAILSELLPGVMSDFHWPKSMRWSDLTIRWIRPIRSILCVLTNSATNKSEIVEFSFGPIKASNITYGHRFMAPAAIVINNPDEYLDKLERAKVIVDYDERCRIIEHQLAQLTKPLAFTAVFDQQLVLETAGLCEWPVVKIGYFDHDLLELPPEVIKSSIKNHQRCFALIESATSALAPAFALVANIEAKDAGKALIAGNERVITARLADARFFWHKDLQIRLDDNLDKLAKMVFYQGLGNQRDRALRLENMSLTIAKALLPDDDNGEDGTCELAARAGLLAKTDLVSNMVGEFPELQGVMGYYYALKQGEDERVAVAIRDHYQPFGSNEVIPTDRVSIAVALADKIDMLTAFWSIDKKPSGSGDPFALRRAAIGIIRIILNNRLNLPLTRLIGFSDLNNDKAIDLANFIIERFKIYLKDQGMRYDIINAVSHVSTDSFDLTNMRRRIKALTDLINSPQGIDVLGGYKRAANLLKGEKNANITNKLVSGFITSVDVALLADRHERELFHSITANRIIIDQALINDDFSLAIKTLAGLRQPVDNFFNNVTVNVADDKLRYNRLALLKEMVNLMELLADFSAIEGK